MCSHGAPEEVPVGDEVLPLMPRSLLKNLVFLDVADVEVTLETGTPAGPDVELVELATCDRLLWLIEALFGRDWRKYSH